MRMSGLPALLFRMDHKGSLFSGAPAACMKTNCAGSACDFRISRVCTAVLGAFETPRSENKEETILDIVPSD